MPKNVIQHYEWTTTDTDRLKRFFGSVFDWKFFEPMPGYTMIEGIGAIFQAPDSNMPIVITPYVTVADLDETERRLAAAGAPIHKSKEVVEGRGWFTIFGDPDGNMVAAWQAMPPPKQPKKKPVPRKKARPASAKKR